METNALMVMVLDAAAALFLIYTVYYVSQKKKSKLVTTPPPELKPKVTTEPPNPVPIPPAPETKPMETLVEAPKPESVKAAPQPVVAVVAQKSEPSSTPEKATKKHKAPSEKERSLPVIEIEGIGKKYSEKLHAVGIYYTAELLKEGATPNGRKGLAGKTGISHELILEWVNLSDLFRIKGIGEEYSDLLEEVGVDTVVELSHRNAENLHAKILEVNELKKLVRRPPTLANIEGWIKEAKSLPRVIEY
jgi:predicted flap endonuclease-1-like 5' DNA nuclease